VGALPRAAKLYIAAFVLIAGFMIAISIPLVPTTPSGLATIGLFALMLCLADLLPIVMLAEKGEVVMSTAIHIASIILFGPAFTVVTTTLGTLAAEIIERRVWYKAAFNVAQFVVTVATVGTIYVGLADENPAHLNSLPDFMALLIAALVYFLFNDSLVPLAVALTERIPVLTVWRTAFRDVAWHNLAMIPLGVMFALLWQVQPWSVVLAILPMFILRLSMGLVRQLRDQTKEALIAMADTIDARDSSTYQHSQRVAEYAEMIARQMGLPYDEVELIVTSARLHDLGKIGMDNVMLYKPGPLSNEERGEFQRHPSIGESLVGYFPAFGAGRELVRHHHEHFDGRGYPNGKKGEEIPQGARILAVADAYDAMTSDRPYRSAMSRETAIARLRAASGTQFDPQVVEAFLTALAKKKEEREDMPVGAQPQLEEASSEAGER
jgi:hypothetical protein